MTVKAKSTPSSLTFSPSSVTLTEGTNGTVNVKFSGDGLKTLNVESSNTSVCTAYWSGTTDWKAGTSTLTVKGKKAGSANITVSFLNNSGKKFYSKSFSVSVKNNATPATYYVKTNGANLIVRSAPSNGATIGKLANGTAISVYSISDGWAKIQYEGGIGYVSATYLTKEKPKPSEWQWPMTNAQCSWTSYGSTWSWGEHKTGGSGGRNYHLAIDLKGSNGNVYAAADGKVVACSSVPNGRNGRYIVIQHNLNGKTVYSFYAHLSRVDVTKEKNVSKGMLIGVYGGSGDNREDYYKTHLHFAIMDTLWESGGYWGYAYQSDFTGNTAKYDGVTYYNPQYIIANGCLP